MTNARDHQGLERLPAEGAGERTAAPTGDLGKDIEAPQPRFFLKAAVVVASAALLVAGIGIGRAMLWPSKPYSTRTLLYRDAILILVDTRETDDRRDLSAGRVFRAIITGIRALKRARDEGGELEQHSRQILRELRELLPSKSVFVPLRHTELVLDFDEPILELAGQLKDNQLPPADMLKTQRELAKQIRLGVLSLKNVDAQPGLFRSLRANLSAYLRTLRRELAN